MSPETTEEEEDADKVNVLDVPFTSKSVMFTKSIFSSVAARNAAGLWYVSKEGDRPPPPAEESFVPLSSSSDSTTTAIATASFIDGFSIVKLIASVSYSVVP